MLIILVPNYFDYIFAFNELAPAEIAVPAALDFSLMAAPAAAVFSFTYSLDGIFYLAVYPKF